MYLLMTDLAVTWPILRNWLNKQEIEKLEYVVVAKEEANPKNNSKISEKTKQEAPHEQ